MADKIEKIKVLSQKGKLDKIAKFFDDKDVAVRAAAYEALRADDSDDAREYLRTAVTDSEPQIRLAAANAIKYIGNTSLSEVVRRQMLKETDETLRKAMEEAEDTCRKRAR